jgi:twitching motility protein PilT
LEKWYNVLMDKQEVILVYERALAAGASDLHLVVGSPILFRIDGELIPQTQEDITAQQADEFVKSLLDERFERFQREREIDLSYALPNGMRVRVNCHYERGNISMVSRIIPDRIPTLTEIDLDEIGQRVMQIQAGLVLFTGPTGAGKSTALAALVNKINSERARNIITLEDPIEFLFPRGKGLVRQREYGQDFLSFGEALKHVLRQDPDIVMVGEMRDTETIAAALTLAETGHLIFATLHTPDAEQTIDRIVDVFPPHQQAQVRSQFSLSLRAIVAQQLLPRLGGGRVALREVLYNSTAVSHIIRDRRTQELTSVMQTSEEVGMQTYQKSAQMLYEKGLIEKELYETIKASGTQFSSGKGQNMNAPPK